MEPLQPHVLRQGQSASATFGRIAVEMWRQACSVFTLPAEMIFCPQFGTRYFHPVVVVLALIAAYGMVYASVAFGFYIPRPGSEIPGYFLKGVYLGYLIHFVRLVRRMKNPRLEPDSEWEGPPLPIFRYIPFGNNWAVRRVIYEPGIVAFFAFCLLLWDNFAFSDAHTRIDFSRSILLIAFAMFLKAAFTLYESWSSLRDLLDKTHRTTILQSLTQDLGNVSVGRYPLSPLATAPESQRADLMATVARID